MVFVTDALAVTPCPCARSSLRTALSVRLQTPRAPGGCSRRQENPRLSASFPTQGRVWPAAGHSTCCKHVWPRQLLQVLPRGVSPGPPAARGSGRSPHPRHLRRGGIIYLANFRGRRFNCFKLLLEKLEWSTINQADLPPRAHPLRAGNQLPPRDLLLMNFAELLIS